MPIPFFSNKYSDRSWRENKHHREHGFSNRVSGKEALYHHKRHLFSLFKSQAKWIGLGIGIIVLIFVIWGLSFMAKITKDLPNPNQLIQREIPQTTKIYDREGKTVLYEVAGAEKRTLVQLSEIPDEVKWAAIAIEDKDFYKHGGFSPFAIFRSVVKYVLFGQKAGGSTLTQQFVKNAVLTPERTFARKVKEIILAQKIEKSFSKDEILQMYLNEIPYGSNIYGVEAASQFYFGKTIKEINLPEAAILAALPQAPSRYSPYGPNKDLLIGRQHYILEQMYKQGYISEAKFEAAKEYKLEFRKPENNIIAPHFVMYVKDLLAGKYGDALVERGGLKVYTTLDLNKQKIAEEIIARKALENEKRYEAKNAALVSIDPKTGQILTMVGSRDYFNNEIDGQVNIALQPRQPGSSVKPLVYATLFTKGFTPNTILYDVVTNFSTTDKPYEPHNYNDKENGPVTIRKALAGSLNIPAVKALYLADLKNVLNLMEKMGYSTLSDRDRFGLSFTLGGGEVKLLEHVNAFSAFAREGKMNDVSAILKVEDKDGNVLEEYTKKERTVMSDKVARMINSILSDNDARSFIFGAQNKLILKDRPVAAKTGTTNDWRDGWTIGYTPSIVAGVWVGNNDNSKMKKGSDGGIIAAPIWNEYMEKVLVGTPVEKFKDLGDVKTGKPILDGELDKVTDAIKIDKFSGLLATEYTPPQAIKEVNVNQNHCILYYIDKNNPLGDTPKDPNKDPQFVNWEKAVVEWVKKQKKDQGGEIIESIPTEKDNVHLPENMPSLEIISPTDKQTINNSVLTAQIQTSAKRGVVKAEYYLNNNLLATSSAAPFDLNKSISFLNNGYHNLKVRVCDDVENCTEKSLDFNLAISGSVPQNKTVVSFVYPKNGLAVNKIDFPLKLKVGFSGLEQIAKVNIYLVDSTKKQTLITSLGKPSEAVLEIPLENAPEKGEYQIFAEAYNWNGDVSKTKEVFLTISN